MKWIIFFFFNNVIDGEDGGIFLKYLCIFVVVFLFWFVNIVIRWLGCFLVWIIVWFVDGCVKLVV